MKLTENEQKIANSITPEQLLSFRKKNFPKLEALSISMKELGEWVKKNPGIGFLEKWDEITKKNKI